MATKETTNYDCNYKGFASFSQDKPHSFYNYPHLSSSSSWYYNHYGWPQYFWWGHNPSTTPSTCETCVEEQHQRQQRARCDDSNCYEGSSHHYVDHSRGTVSRNNGRTTSGSLSEFQQNYNNCDSENINEHSVSSSSEDELEIELDHEFKKFLEQSARHKEQRKKEAAMTIAETDDYIEAGEVALEATTEAPSQQQSILRREEMKKLYGKSARNIESLETSLQLHFNMNVNMRYPTFWPSIPLKF